MRVLVLSDLHTEFAPFERPAVEVDAVVLAGDIGVGLGAIEFAQSTFPDVPVVFVAGNHEYYRGALPRLTQKFRDATHDSNVHVLDDESVEIDGVRFLGATLWTDYAIFGEDRRLEAMEVAHARLNDHRLIRHSPRYGKLSPRTCLAVHRRSRSWLKSELAQAFDGRTVVVTHHAPSMRSCPARYQRDVLTAAFVSDVEALMGPPDIWIHGHTHHCVDYIVNGTRVVSNQRGYLDEPVEGFRPDFVVEL